MARCRNGDAAAFGELVAKYRNKVYSTLYNLVRNEQDAWDLAQESFLKAWRNLPRFREESSFFTWVYRIATNIGLDALRRKKIEGGVEFDDAVAPHLVETSAPTAPHPERAPHERLRDAEIRARIEEALALLSAEHRAVVVLREIEGLSYEEIAEAAGCSVGTVMSRLFYARKKLQTLLRDVYETL